MVFTTLSELDIHHFKYLQKAAKIFYQVNLNSVRETQDSPLSPTLPAPVFLVSDPPSGRRSCPRPSRTARASQGTGMLIALKETVRGRNVEVYEMSLHVLL